MWRDSESECSGEIIQSFQHTTYDMSSLRPDTTYKVELRAHNAIGLSSPAEIRVRTARGEQDQYYSYSLSSEYNTNGSVNNQVLFILNFLIIFYFTTDLF